jgi:hypothetical protein
MPGFVAFFCLRTSDFGRFPTKNAVQKNISVSIFTVFFLVVSNIKKLTQTTLNKARRRIAFYFILCMIKNKDSSIPLKEHRVITQNAVSTDNMKFWTDKLDCGRNEDHSYDRGFRTTSYS